MLYGEHWVHQIEREDAGAVLSYHESCIELSCRLIRNAWVAAYPLRVEGIRGITVNAQRRKHRKIRSNAVRASRKLLRTMPRHTCVLCDAGKAPLDVGKRIIRRFAALGGYIVELLTGDPSFGQFGIRSFVPFRRLSCLAVHEAYYIDDSLHRLIADEEARTDEDGLELDFGDAPCHLHRGGGAVGPRVAALERGDGGVEPASVAL